LAEAGQIGACRRREKQHEQAENSNCHFFYRRRKIAQDLRQSPTSLYFQWVMPLFLEQAS